MPKRPCLSPGCREYAIPTGKGRCPDHARLNDKSIGRAGRQVYRTSKWQHTRRAVLSDEPMCRYCAAAGREQLAEEVHHIDGDPFNNARENLSPICKPCHSRTTRAEQLNPARTSTP